MQTPYTTGEAAKLCRISIHKVTDSLDSGLLEGFYIPGSTHRRIPRKNVPKFLAKAGIPMEHTILNQANRLLLFSGREDLMQAMRDHMHKTQFCLYTPPNSLQTGLIVAESIGKFCLAVIDMTSPPFDPYPLIRSLVARDWEVILLAKRGQPTIAGVSDVFYLPVDPQLLAARIQSLIAD